MMKVSVKYSAPAEAHEMARHTVGDRLEGSVKNSPNPAEAVIRSLAEALI